MIMVLPDEDGPNSFARSTLMIRVLPSTVISMFFMLVLHAASFIRTFWALNCLAGCRREQLKVVRAVRQPALSMLWQPIHGYAAAQSLSGRVRDAIRLALAGAVL